MKVSLLLDHEKNLKGLDLGIVNSGVVSTAVVLKTVSFPVELYIFLYLWHLCYCKSYLCYCFEVISDGERQNWSF